MGVEESRKGRYKIANPFKAWALSYGRALPLLGKS